MITWQQSCIYVFIQSCEINESTTGNKVTKFFIVLLFLLFIALVYLSYYIDLLWVFISKKMSFYLFTTSSQNLLKIKNNLNAAKCNRRPQMRRITMNEQSTNNGLTLTGSYLGPIPYFGRQVTVWAWSTQPAFVRKLLLQLGSRRSQSAEEHLQ